MHKRKPPKERSAIPPFIAEMEMLLKKHKAPDRKHNAMHTDKSLIGLDLPEKMKSRPKRRRTPPKPKHVTAAIYLLVVYAQSL